jgi:dihydroflavonol-4-reductase
MNLIVGGTGFVGGHLAEYFFKEGEISKGTFRKGSHLRILDQCGIQCLEADLLDRETLHEPLDMVDVVYNLASPTPRDGDEDFLTVNTKGLRNLLEEAAEHGAKEFVHLSTLDVCGFKRRDLDESSGVAPAHPYQQAKAEAERLVQAFGKEQTGMRVKIVRAARATGARDATLAAPLLRMIAHGRVVLPSGSEAQMSFTHPKDIAQALVRAASNGENGRVYLVKSFDASLDEMAAKVAQASGARLDLRREGIFAKTTLPPYTAAQVRAGLRIREQGSWTRIWYSPAYDAKKTCTEIAEWSAKEPWVTQDSLA